MNQEANENTQLIYDFKTLSAPVMAFASPSTESADHGSFSTEVITTLRENLIKIGAKVVRQAGYVTFQMAEVAIPHKLFRQFLVRIARLRTTVPALTPG